MNSIRRLSNKFEKVENINVFSIAWKWTNKWFGLWPFSRRAHRHRGDLTMMWCLSLRHINVDNHRRMILCRNERNKNQMEIFSTILMTNSIFIHVYSTCLSSLLLLGFSHFFHYSHSVLPLPMPKMARGDYGLINILSLWPEPEVRRRKYLFIFIFFAYFWFLFLCFFHFDENSLIFYSWRAIRIEWWRIVTDGFVTFALTLFRIGCVFLERSVIPVALINIQPSDCGLTGRNK